MSNFSGSGHTMVVWSCVLTMLQFTTNPREALRWFTQWAITSWLTFRTTHASPSLWCQLLENTAYKEQCLFHNKVASFPGPAQLSVACSSRAGRASACLAANYRHQTIAGNLLLLEVLLPSASGIGPSRGACTCNPLAINLGLQSLRYIYSCLKKW